MLGKKTGGRTKGTANKKTRAIADAAAANGITPLEYMLMVLRDETQPAERRDWAAEKAAPYIHPKLQTSTIKGTGDDGEIKLGMKIEYVAADNSPTAGQT